MKATVVARTAEEARALAQDKLGAQEVHISCVLFYKEDPKMRHWVFSTEVRG